MHGITQSLENGNKPLTVVVRVQIEVDPRKDPVDVQKEVHKAAVEKVREQYPDAKGYSTVMRGWDY